MNLSIKLKLMLLGGIGMVIALVLAATGYRAIQSFGEANRSATVLVEALRNQQNADMMHDALRADILSALSLTEDGKPEAKDVQELRADLQEHVQNFTEAMAANAKLDLPASIKTSLATVAPKLDTYIKQSQTEMDRIFQDRRLGKSGLDAFQNAFRELEDPMAALSELIDRTNQERQREAAEAGEAAKTRIAWTALVALGVLVGASASIGTSITRPLNQLREGMEQVSQGDADLTRRIHLAGGDEVAQTAQAFNRFVESLSDLVGRLQLISTRVAQASSQIAEGNAGLQNRTEQQAASLEQTSASMVQITEGVTQTAQLTAAAATRTEKSRLATQGGKDIANNLLERMAAIQASSSRIADIIGVVDEIAFQTNLLALNAAVEAARAGEQGRGFAVVASEVRSLALRSSKAAQEIKRLIHESVALAGEGARVASQTCSTMDGILLEMNEVAGQIHHIAQASRTQEASIQEASRAMSFMDKGTQQNAAMVEEAAAASLALDDDAQSLAQEVGRFKTEGRRTGGRATLRTR